MSLICLRSRVMQPMRRLKIGIAYFIKYFQMLFCNGEGLFFELFCLLFE